MDPPPPWWHIWWTKLELRTLPPPPPPLVAHLVDKVGTKDPPPPSPPPLVAHLVDKVGTKDPPPPLVAHLVDKVGTKDPPPPPPPSPPPPPLGRLRAGGTQSRFELPSCIFYVSCPLSSHNSGSTTVTLSWLYPHALTLGFDQNLASSYQHYRTLMLGNFSSNGILITRYMNRQTRVQTSSLNRSESTSQHITRTKTK